MEAFGARLVRSYEVPDAGTEPLLKH